MEISIDRSPGDFSPFIVIKSPSLTTRFRIFLAANDDPSRNRGYLRPLIESLKILRQKGLRDSSTSFYLCTYYYLLVEGGRYFIQRSDNKDLNIEIDFHSREAMEMLVERLAEYIEDLVK